MKASDWSIVTINCRPRFSHLPPIRIEVHMTHSLLHAEAALVESLAVSVDHINKPDWSTIKIKASDR